MKDSAVGDVTFLSGTEATIRRPSGRYQSIARVLQVRSMALCFSHYTITIKGKLNSTSSLLLCRLSKSSKVWAFLMVE
jgi:hypothetical protein